MSACVDEVALAMQGKVLTPEELMQIGLWCSEFPAFMVVHQIKFNRAVTELGRLLNKKGKANDQELMEMAFALLAVLMDPDAAFEQADAQLTKSRQDKVEADIKDVVERALKARKAAKLGIDTEAGGLGGGPKN